MNFSTSITPSSGERTLYLFPSNSVVTYLIPTISKVLEQILIEEQVLTPVMGGLLQH